MVRKAKSGPARRPASTPPPGGLLNKPRRKPRGKGLLPAVPAAQFNIKRFKDIHKGKRCFVIGNGPSLRKINLGKLRTEITFAGNNFWSLPFVPWKPNYYSVIELPIFRKYRKHMTAYKGPTKFYPYFCWRFLHRRYVDVDKNTYFVPADNGLERDRTLVTLDFSTDVARIAWCGATVVHFMMQMAFYMGCDPIYLIGVDFSEGHAIQDKDYFAGDHKSFPKVPAARWFLITRFMERARQVIEWQGRRVFNATPGGNLHTFERVDYTSLF